MTKLYKYLRALAVAALTVAALTLNWAAPAAAGGPGVEINPVSQTRPEFDFEVYGDECQAVAVDDLSVVDEDGAAVDDVEFRLDSDNGLTGTVIIGDSVPGDYYVFAVDCGAEPYETEIAFGRSIITKKVVGDAPADASFVVNVLCDTDNPDSEPVDVDLTFPVAGGTKHLINYEGTTCTVTETDDGGAESSSIDNPELEFDDPMDLTAVVTNTFAEASGEQPDPGPGDEPETPRGDDPLDESTPAAPVTAKPALTG